MANTWLQAAQLLGFTVHVSTPGGYEVNPSVAGVTESACFKVFADPLQACKGADLVTTDVWTSMGYEAENEARRQAFESWCVDETMMSEDDYYEGHDEDHSDKDLEEGDESEYSNEELEEMTEEEQLEEAKKSSRKKSENYDQSKMLKKLLIETVLKIVVGSALIIAVVFAVVEFMPIIASFFSGFVIKLITGK